MAQPALPPGFVPASQMQKLPDGFVVKEPSLMEKAKAVTGSISDFFTGADRETDATRNLDELRLGLDGFGVPAITQAKIAAGLLSTFDGRDQLDIIKSNLEPLGIRVAEQTDEKGNLIVALQKGNRITQSMLNKPGASGIDVMQGTANAAAFTPSGKLATGARGMLSAAGRVGLGSAATQGVLTGIADVTGAEKTLADYATEAGVAGIAGGSTEFVMQGLSKFPALRGMILEKLKAGATQSQVAAELKKIGVSIGLDESGAAQASNDILERYAAAAQEAATPDEALSKALSSEFGISYTKGKATLDPAQLSLEDTMRVGGKGEKARQIILAADEKARVETLKAADDIAATMAGNGPVISARSEAGAMLRDAIKNEEAALDAAKSAAYDAAKGKASLKAEGIRPILANMKKAVSGAEWDKSLPETAKILAEIQKQERIIARASSDPRMRVKDLPIEAIEVMRKRVNNAFGAAANATDRQQVRQIKAALDSSMDDAVASALIAGDAEALNAMKQARGLAREYFAKFTTQPVRGIRSTFSDPAGAFIDKIVSANPTDTEIVNAMFTASSFNNRAGSAMAQRFKAIVGPESAEWNAVKQAAFRDLLKTNTVNGKEVISGQRTVTAIRDAMKKNPELMREIFNQDEIQKIARFAAAVQRTQPTLIRSAETPSGKHAAMALSDKVREMLPILSGNLGIQLSSLGWTVAKNMRGTGAAKEAVRPFTRAAIVRPELVGAGTAGAMAYGNQ